MVFEKKHRQKDDFGYHVDAGVEFRPVSEQSVTPLPDLIEIPDEDDATSHIQI